MSLLELLRPRLYLVSIFDLDLEALGTLGIRGIILDLDNTLLPYGSQAVTEEVRQWLRQVQEAGFAVSLVTNTWSRRRRTLAQTLGIPVAPGWVKPAASMFRRAMAMMGTAPRQTAMIGDQLLTDILGGNRLGLYTILVTPIGGREFPGTRFITRAIERFLLRLLKVDAPARRPAAGRSA